MGKGIDGDRHIASERSESAYSWDIDGDGKTEEVGNRDKVESIKIRQDVCYTNTHTHTHTYTHTHTHTHIHTPQCSVSVASGTPRADGYVQVM